MSVILVVAGLAVLLVLFVDVFSTVFDPRGRGGPLNRRLNRAFWHVARKLPGGDSILAIAAPLMVVVTLLSWVVLLIGGFAAIYYPFIGNFLVSPGSLRNPWAESLYYSGYTAATLGFGDIVPDRAAIRLLAPVEAVLGFALVSVSVTYLLAIYRELLAMQSLSAFIASYTDDTEQLLATIQEAKSESPQRFAETVHASLLRVLESHFQYPILHYFRPPDRSRALPVQLSGLLELMTRMDCDSSSARLPFRNLEKSIDEYMLLVEKHFIPERFETGVERDRERDRALVRLLRYMEYR